jgi:protein-S-isoprenylcysteine O-methyltransferase Ste14
MAGEVSRLWNRRRPAARYATRHDCFTTRANHGYSNAHVPEYQSSFSSATIEIADDQRVGSRGVYGKVRHPMYAGALVVLAGMPIALGSWWGLLVLLAMLPAPIWRVFDEEKLLTENLPGYAEYTEKVRYRLIPGPW